MVQNICVFLCLAVKNDTVSLSLTTHSFFLFLPLSSDYLITEVVGDEGVTPRKFLG